MISNGRGMRKRNGEGAPGGASARACLGVTGRPERRTFYGRGAGAARRGRPGAGRVGRGRSDVPKPGGYSDAATDARLAAGRPAGHGPVADGGEAGPGAELQPRPLLLLPLPPVPAQLLAAGVE